MIKLVDRWQFSLKVMAMYPGRTLVLVLAVAIGVSSVLLLTSIGEGARLYINKEFNSIGSDLLIVLPGKKQTSGGSLPFYSTTPRELTWRDALAIKQLSNVEFVAPINAGTALVSAGNLSREVITIGSTSDFLIVRKLVLAKGRGFYHSEQQRIRHEAIIGSKLKKSLFGDARAVGQWLNIADRRYRVVGVLKERGESLGLDMRDMAIIPISSAESLFNSTALFRIIVSLKQKSREEVTKQQIINLIKQRHDGEEDITIVSQNAMMDAFNNITQVVTIAIGVIAGISLLVAGFLIMNVSYISVVKRKAEIGLLKAIGASSNEVQLLFLQESSVLTIIGAVLGVTLGYALVFTSNAFIPYFSLAIPLWSTLTTLIVAVLISIGFTWFPAKKASSLDPVIAMRGN
ncbi:FtsX-like permease family protein [Thalassotalea sp. M1531]|uniref:FtsX-like permease family protein n=1 Tax=Thalassotalea algicola TaxID=2716224 RepID=A0A7Y0LAJ7_9GAMM|nr:ABC transporter permease [Thalassotalea algicola]NMP30881.1 FtsX-like permease family protein [Thalassotalea algicola]